MLIKDIVKILTDSGIEPNEANIEVKLLIEHYAGYSLADILMGKKLDEEKLKIVEQKAKYRAKTKEPIQYIIGFADFMGEKFIVDKNVLIPRDETEFLVRQAIKLIDKNGFKSVLDMCTGSGCIACMIAKLATLKVDVLGVDISTQALHVAIENMERFKLFNKATFRKSDLFAKIRADEKFDIIVSNPPYIPEKLKPEIQTEVSHEPEIALYTKDDEGVDFYRAITEKSIAHINKGGYLLYELGINQSASVAQIMSENGYTNIQVIKDLAGIDRVIFGKKE